VGILVISTVTEFSLYLDTFMNNNSLNFTPNSLEVNNKDINLVIKQVEDLYFERKYDWRCLDDLENQDLINTELLVNVLKVPHELIKQYLDCYLIYSCLDSKQVFKELKNDYFLINFNSFNYICKKLIENKYIEKSKCESYDLENGGIFYCLISDEYLKTSSIPNIYKLNFIKKYNLYTTSKNSESSKKVDSRKIAKFLDVRSRDLNDCINSKVELIDQLGDINKNVNNNNEVYYLFNLEQASYILSVYPTRKDHIEKKKFDFCLAISRKIIEQVKKDKDAEYRNKVILTEIELSQIMGTTIEIEKMIDFNASSDCNFKLFN
jgi:hypothetical protein